MVDKLGDVLKEGFLSKQSKYLKEWRQRWFVLTSDALYSFKEEKSYKSPTETIQLKDCTTIKSAEDEVKKENSFRIDCGERIFFIIANSNTEKESWIGAIGKAMVKLNMKKQNMND
eukprot:TRINITY_DN4691_c0_g1_i1.p2 TRINITY_DN4691_c0_g1~~TRINITY_DN4691_c0_g1_i1.p2  ORF type:complete len:116 (-),score=28.06 TRINITY_DN4691_c0_g1_i1:117-464(-)